jgi:hypothetical protein
MGTRAILALSAFLALALLLPSDGWGQNAHFVGGEPTVSTTENSVCVSGKAAGLGNIPLQVAIEITAVATTNCVNPAGNVAPGQGTVTTTKTASASFQPDKNGNVRFSLCNTISPADFPTPTAEEAGCPNPNWTVAPIQAQDITITGFRVIISHQGRILFERAQ